jgi:hypothetical protein
VPEVIPHRAEEFGRWLDEFQGESDRACAVLAGAFLEALLADLLTKFFVEHVKVEEFLGAGRLWTFDLRIDLAFAAGLITDTERRELHLIRKTRNDFAHDLIGVTFDSPKIKARCSELLVPSSYGFTIPSNAALPTRLRFCSAAVFLAVLLRERIGRTGHIDELTSPVEDAEEPRAEQPFAYWPLISGRVPRSSARPGTFPGSESSWMGSQEKSERVSIA